MAKNSTEPTPTGLAIAIIALARFVRAETPGLVPYLQLTLGRARDLGVADADLAFMETLIGALSVPAGKPGP